MHQDQTQPAFCVGQTPFPLKESMSPGSLIEVLRKPIPHDFPLFRQCVMRHAPEVTSRNKGRQAFRLMLMGVRAHTAFLGPLVLDRAPKAVSALFPASHRTPRRKRVSE